MPSLANQEVFLSLIRLGIGHSVLRMPLISDWSSIEAFANEQGLSAILVDGVERLPEKERPPKPILLQWIGESLQSYEYRYDLYQRAIAELAAIYNKHGYRMMILKGYACSLDWPKPEHRPCGDIDIWLFGQQKEADAALEASFKIQDPSFKIDNSHHHHTVFYWRDFMVENHFDFDNVYARKSNKEIEPIFKQMGMDDSHFVDLYGERVFIPSPNLHALFLIRHMAAHFVGSNITLRQVLDWAFFVEKHTIAIDWEWLRDMLKKYRMMDFFNCINAICVDNLGFSFEIFPKVQYIPMLKEKVLNDILYPDYTLTEAKGLLERMFYKYRRWKGNGWKHEMCYNESRWSAFWSGIWAKMLKPASI